MNVQFVTRETPIIAIPERVVVLENLSVLRLEWEEGASGKSLLEVEGNIGIVLADLVNSFELASHEQSLVLGPLLFEKMREILYQPSRN